MKHDMSGAAAVVGLLRACALLRFPMPVIGVIGKNRDGSLREAERHDVVASAGGTR